MPYAAPPAMNIYKGATAITEAGRRLLLLLVSKVGRKTVFQKWGGARDAPSRPRKKKGMDAKKHEPKTKSQKPNSKPAQQKKTITPTTTPSTPKPSPAESHKQTAKRQYPRKSPLLA